MIRKYLKYFPLLFVFSLPALLSIRQLDDPDLWWHLKDGERIVTEHSLPSTDAYSFTVEGSRWVDGYAISQVSMYMVHKYFSAAGIELSTALIVCITFLFAFLALNPGRRKSAQENRSELVYALAFAAFMLPAAMLGFERYTPRPSVMTTLFVVLFFMLLEREDLKISESVSHTRFPWLMAILMVLWVNIHSGFPAGVVLISMYFGASVLRLVWAYLARKFENIGDDKSENIKLLSRNSSTLFLALVLAAGAIMVNPYGFDIFSAHTEIALYPVYQEAIVEWRPLFAAPRSGPAIHFYFKLCAALLTVSFLLNFRKLRLNHVLVSCAFVFMAYSSRRHVDIFAIISCPIFAHNISVFLTSFKLPSRIKPIWPALISTVAIVSVAASLGFYIISGGLYYDQRLTHIFGIGENPKIAAGKMVQFFDKSDELKKSRVFNSYTLGGYLLFNWYPEKKVFIDGRIFPYGPEFLYKYNRSLIDPATFDEIVKKWDITAVMLTFYPFDSMNLIKRLNKSDEWAMVYLDENGVIFLKKAAYSESTVTEFEINPASGYTRFYVAGTSSFPGISGKPYLIPNVSLAAFYVNVGVPDKAYEVINKALAQDPQNPVLRNTLGTFFMSVGKLELAVNELEHATSLAPNYYEAYVNKARALLKLGRAGEAVTALHVALDIFPEGHDALVLAGKIEYGDNNLKQALQYFKAMKNEYPDNVTASYWYALTLSRLEPEKSEALWREHLMLLFRFGGQNEDIKAAREKLAASKVGLN